MGNDTDGRQPTVSDASEAQDDGSCACSDVAILIDNANVVKERNGPKGKTPS